jgi:hypothetical protein
MPEIPKKWPDILPPADLLVQIDGVERGLRQRRRLGNVGWTGALIAAALQVLVTLHNAKWFADLSEALGELNWDQVLQQVPFILPLFLLVLSLILTGWAKFWLKESQEPFRYSCSVADLSPIGAKEREDKSSGFFHDLEEKLSWLPHDLEENLSRRVGRLRFLAEQLASADAGRTLESHIHIGGSYVVRKDRDDCWTLEIMPRVRVGPSKTPETLAHPVLFKLGRDAVCDAGTRQAGPQFLSHEKYEKIVERLYFSVATEVYQQIQEDVLHKIELLPTSYFRAVAYFYEAEDYARSNTLDAYKEASKLYRQAMELFDSCLRPLPKSGLWRYLSLWWRQCLKWLHRVPKRWASFLWPRLAHVEVMCAKAEIGYANMLLYSRFLAGMSGDRLNPVFEARPLSADAVKRLENLPKDVAVSQASLFDAYVTLALALSSLGSAREPKEWLSKAQRLNPNRAEEDARYLFVAGELEAHLQSKMNMFRRAVELNPRFEVAQWSLAYTFERMWRARPSLERNVAELVLHEYGEVLKINPGNIAAWANRGYIEWLLSEEVDNFGSLQAARENFEGGREYKTIERKTFVSELDYGLARIAAETGEFKIAYQHYVDAVSALLAQGAYHTDGYSRYYFDLIGEKLFERFTRYKQRVERAYSSDKESSFPRIKRCVYAFVLNDYGEACLSYYQRSGDPEFLQRAGDAFEQAAVLNPQYVLPRYNHSFVEQENGHLDRAEADLQEVHELQPNWPDGEFELARIRMTLPKRAQDLAKEKEKDANENTEEVDRKLLEIKNKGIESQKISREAAQKREQARNLAFSSPRAMTPAQNEVVNPRPEIDLLERDASDLELKAKSLTDGADQLRALVEELKTKAGRLTTEAQLLRQQAKRRVEAVCELPDSLLPHAWLWKRDGPSGRKTLDWRVFHKKDFEVELKWQREFDDLHAKALLILANAHLKKALVVRTEQGEAEGRRAEVQVKRVAELLDCLGKYFWPDHPDRLLAYRELSAQKTTWKESFNDDMRAVIANWLSADPTAHHTLRWVRDESFESSLLTVGDLVGADRLAARLLKDTDPVSRFLLERFPKKIKQLLRTYDGRVYPSEALQSSIVHQLNRILEEQSLYDEQRFAGVELREKTKQLIAQKPNERALLRANRLLLEDAYADTIASVVEKKKRILLKGLTQPDLSSFASQLLGRELGRLELEDRTAIVSEILTTPNLSAVARELLEEQLQQIAPDQQAILLRAVERSHRSSSDFKWFGDQLQKIDKREALVAYRQAGETDDPLVLFELGRSLKRLGSMDDSLRTFKCAVELDLKREKPEIPQEVLHREMGCVLWALKKHEEAISEFEAVRAQDGKLGEQWRKDIIQDVIGTIDSFESYRTLRDWLQRQLETRGAKCDEKARTDAQEAILLLALSKYRDVVQGLSGRQAGAGSANMFAMVTRITVEADVELFPQGDDWVKSHPLFTEYVPEMREQIRAQMGVVIPGVRFQGNDNYTVMPRNSYCIGIDEVPLVTGTVYPKCVFHPSYSALRNRLNIDSSELHVATNPRTGGEGAWLAATTRENIPLDEKSPWNHFEYLIHDLERVLRFNLIAFLGPQEVSDTLNYWQNGGPGDKANERRKLIAQVLPHLSSKLRFVQLLKSLVRELVPIVNLQTILESLTPNRLAEADVGQVVETVRLALRDELPGNLEDSHFFRLAPAFENEISQWVHHANGRTFFAIPPERAEALVSAVGTALSLMRNGRQVIVTQAHGIRPFVRRLIEVNFPRVTVLSWEELRRSLRRSIAGVIEYMP